MDTPPVVVFTILQAGAREAIGISTEILGRRRFMISRLMALRDPLRSDSMPKILFVVMTSALAGAALTYFAVGRRMIAQPTGAGASLMGRARALGDRAGTVFRSAQGAWRTAPGQLNTAFEQHRAETLARLEEEQRSFRDFLRNLRQAKDQAEFDACMAQRQASPAAPEAAPATPPRDTPQVA